MSLIGIVRALDGELYDRGQRAVIPGPGHSRQDRSVSLLLSDGRLIVHSFGRSTWREVLDELRDGGLVDGDGRPHAGAGEGWSTMAPRSPSWRTAVASALWTEATPLHRQSAFAHVRQRGIARPSPISTALRHHGAVPLAVYAGRGACRPALLSAVTASHGALCAIEITYLDPGGSRADGVAIPRKVIGALPPSCAVRLDDPAEEMLVGEGVFTTLSAAGHFGLPGWALLSTRNLRTWLPPKSVRRVLIAADRGVDGERSARTLRLRLLDQGVDARITWPRAPALDWNEACAATGEGEGRAEGGAPGGRTVLSSARDIFL